MKFFTTFDDKFVHLADNDQRRTLAIHRLKSSRSAYYISGILLCAATAVLRLTGHDMGLGFALMGVGYFCISFKQESDIRMLRMVDHLWKKYETRSA